MVKKQVLTPKPGKHIKLADFDPDYHGDWIKQTAKEAETDLEARMDVLQEKLYAQGKYALLVVLQAMDAGGKDGAMKKVFKGVNPQGFKIANFKAPTPLELAHDFLWRVHQQVPPKGYIGIFNRSHYEDVLVVRVNNIVPEDVWRARYDHINNFEKMLSDNGVKILKFFLHISKEEQKERFQARLDDPQKHWKFSLGDLPVREKWEDYMQAYSDAISSCNTDYAPWHIVPANKKWYRDYIITKTIVDTLESMPLKYPDPEPGLDKVVIPD
jgi:PPK2 family polyphosphate:nucleotide phosphotransferase